MSLVGADDDVILGERGISDCGDGVVEEVLPNVELVVVGARGILVGFGLLAEEGGDLGGGFGHADDLLGDATATAATPSCAASLERCSGEMRLVKSGKGEVKGGGPLRTIVPIVCVV